MMTRIHFESVTPVSPDDDASDRARRARIPAGRIALLALIASAIVGAGAWLQLQVEDPATAIAWQETCSIAEQSQRNIAVVFTQADCVPCARMKNETLADPMIRSLVERGWLIHEVDLDAAGAGVLATRFEVAQVPELVLTTARGIVLTDHEGTPLRSSGYIDTTEFRALLTRGRGGDGNRLRLSTATANDATAPAPAQAQADASD